VSHRAPPGRIPLLVRGELSVQRLVRHGLHLCRFPWVLQARRLSVFCATCSAPAWRPGHRIGEATIHRSGGARELELVARLAGGGLTDVDEHDRASSVQLVQGARHSVVVERGPVEEPPELAEAGDAPVLSVVVADDHDAVDVPERTLALLVGIAGEGTGALAAPNHAAAEGSDRGIATERSGVLTDGFLANVAERSARQ
jgi:hypothetical protein